MNTKHTLGPWAIRDDDEQGQVSIVGGSGIVLALVRTATVEPGEENARLIAAAPELLSELKRCLEVMEHRCPEAHCLPDARAAIAKAGGEA